MRFLMAFCLVLLTFSCGGGNSNSKSKFDLSGTWESNSKITNSSQKVLIKDNGNEVELTYCGFESEIFFEDSNNLYYSGGSPHHFTIDSNEKLLASGDLGWNNTRYLFRDLDKISNGMNFNDGLFSFKSENIVDKNLNSNVCVNKGRRSYVSHDYMVPVNGTHIEMVSYENSSITMIRIFSSSIDIGSYDVSDERSSNDQEIHVEFVSSEFTELYGQNVIASSGTVWIDTYSESVISGSGVIELSESFDNRVIEFSFELNL